LTSNARSVCSLEEMDILNKAFLHKKKTLDQIHQQTKKSR
jgi:hypothetical protein